MARFTLVRKILDGKVQIYRQNSSPMLYVRHYVQGAYVPERTMTTDIREAVTFAENWFYQLQAKILAGQPIHEPLFSALVQDFLTDPTNKKHVSPEQFKNHHKKWHLLEPYCRGRRVSEIDTEFLEALQLKRSECKNRYGQPLSANTISKDFVFLGQVLRWAQKRRKNIKFEMPEMPAEKGDFEVRKRARPMLSPDQWEKLRKLAEENIANPPSPGRRGPKRNLERAKELYAFMLFTCGGALRVGEAYSVRWIDCTPVTLVNTDKEETPAIEAMVLGKTSKDGQRQHAYVMYEGEVAFRHLKAARPDAKPEDNVFLYDHEVAFRDLLKQAGLYVEPKTQMTRNTKSLRVTGICLQLARNPAASWRDLGEWCRTSEEMLQQCYNQLHPLASAARVAGKGKKPAPKAWDADWTIPAHILSDMNAKAKALKIDREALRKGLESMPVRPKMDAYGKLI